MQVHVALLAEPKTPLESSVFIGERERANLVVQLARFFYIIMYIGVDVMFYVILNKRKRLGDCVGEQFNFSLHRARAYINTRAR